MPDELWAAALQRAAEKGDTVSAIVRDALRQYVGRQANAPRRFE